MLDLGALKLKINVDSNTAKDGLGDIGDSIENVGEQAQKAKKHTGGLGSSLKDAFTGGAIAGAISNIVGKVGEVIEQTEEYRKILASLKTSSEQAGYTTDQTADTYKQLYEVLGDDQTAATTTANLQALGLSQTQLTDITNGAIGAWSKYGDSIPIDGLAEAINETAKTGTVTGNFADVLNWAGTNQDDFNEKLSNCSSTSERVNLIMQEMSKQGLMDAADSWKENNKDITAANNAQLDFQNTMSRIATVISPAVSAVKTEALQALNQVIDVVMQYMPQIQLTVQAVITFVKGLIDELLPVIQKIIDVIKDVVTQAQTEGTAFNAIWKGIQAVFTSVIKIIQDVFKAFSALFTGDWKKFWNSILDIFKNLKDAFKAAGKAVFTALWDGLKDIWTSISTWVSDKVSWIINSITSALSFGGSSGGGGRTSGSHRNGLEEVPYDGYIAELHKGEMVLTAAEANQYKSGSTDLVNALSTVLGMSNQSTNQPVYLTVQVGTEKLGETIVNLYDDTTAQLGTRKVVKV